MHNVDFGGRYHPLSDRKDNIENKVAIRSMFNVDNVQTLKSLLSDYVSRSTKITYRTLRNLWTNGSRRGPGEDKMLIYRYHIRTQNSVESTR